MRVATAVVTERDDGRRHDAGLTGGPREPLHPANLEADEIAEGRARVEVGAARGIEPAAQLREAERNRQRQEPDQDEADRAPGADLRRHLRGPEKDRRSPVDAEGGEIPSTQRASAIMRGGCIMNARLKAE